jgi:hypothetical protein
MYASLASALPRYVKASEGWSAQCNLRLRCPFGTKRAADHHMKPPNGSMSKEAESAVDEAPHRDQGAAQSGSSR